MKKLETFLLAVLPVEETMGRNRHPKSGGNDDNEALGGWETSNRQMHHLAILYHSCETVAAKERKTSGSKQLTFSHIDA